MKGGFDTQKWKLLIFLSISTSIFRGLRIILM